MDLKTFLLARIAEDEEQAEACRVMGWIPAKKYGITVTNPDRVLAECAAKRAIVEMHELEVDDRSLGKEQGCMICGEWDDYSEWGITGPCDTLRALAAVYADHTDYQPEWKL